MERVERVFKELDWSFYSANTLKAEERRILRELMVDVVIRSSDKGGNVC